MEVRVQTLRLRCCCSFLVRFSSTPRRCGHFQSRRNHVTSVRSGAVQRGWATHKHTQGEYRNAEGGTLHTTTGGVCVKSHSAGARVEFGSSASAFLGPSALGVSRISRRRCTWFVRFRPAGLRRCLHLLPPRTRLISEEQTGAEGGVRTSRILRGWCGCLVPWCGVCVQRVWCLMMR